MRWIDRLLNSRRRACLLVVAAMILAAGYLGQRAARTFFAEYSEFFPSRENQTHLKDGARFQLEDIVFETSDGTHVAGWSLPSRNGAVVVLLHGSPGDRSWYLPMLGSLRASGYGAILLDLPGHGESGGRADWGVSSQRAVQGAIDLALRESGVTQVALIGYSMSGCVAAKAAMQDKRVKALVLLSAFTNLADALRYEFPSRIPMFSEIAILAARAAGVAVDEMRTLDALRMSPPRPVLIIAGTLDRAVPVSMPTALFQAAHEPKELWLVEGAGHLNLRDVAGPEEFDGRLRTFLDKAMFGNRTGVA